MCNMKTWMMKDLEQLAEEVGAHLHKLVPVSIAVETLASVVVRAPLMALVTVPGKPLVSTAGIIEI